MTTEYEGVALVLPKDMETYFGAEICPDTSQGADVNSSPQHAFQPAALGGVPRSEEMISK